MKIKTTDADVPTSFYCNFTSGSECVCVGEKYGTVYCSAHQISLFRHGDKLLKCKNCLDATYDALREECPLCPCKVVNKP